MSTDSTKQYQAGTDDEIPQSFFGTLALAYRRFGIMGSLARFLMIREEHQNFIKQAANEDDRQFRMTLLKQFQNIHKKVKCAHRPGQFLTVAKYLLPLEMPGPIVQCGCFKGGSSCKLSLLAKKTGRKLYVCDSFAGLPPPTASDEHLLKSDSDFVNIEFSEGEYCGTLAEVRSNMANFGCLEVCEFVPGFFADSLPKLDVTPAMVFADVDFISSARDCLRYLWPRLLPGGLWFTHEAAFDKFVYGILDPQWWHATLNECPPVMFGAGNGLSVAAGALGFFRKLLASESPKIIGAC